MSPSELTREEEAPTLGAEASSPLSRLRRRLARDYDVGAVYAQVASTNVSPVCTASQRSLNP